MNENLNLVEILKNCPKGTKLYSPIYGDVELVKVSQFVEYPIEVKLSDNSFDSFSNDGRINVEYSGECLLFPSKDQRNWSNFKPKQPKFDPKTLLPFDRVLVKRGYESYHTWYPDFICLPPTDVDDTIFCIGTNDVAMVIPYNDDTKHLIDTSDEAPEYYRYWED